MSEIHYYERLLIIKKLKEKKQEGTHNIRNGHLLSYSLRLIEPLELFFYKFRVRDNSLSPRNVHAIHSLRNVLTSLYLFNHTIDNAN